MLRDKAVLAAFFLLATIIQLKAQKYPPSQLNEKFKLLPLSAQCCFARALRLPQKPAFIASV